MPDYTKKSTETKAKLDTLAKTLLKLHEHVDGLAKTMAPDEKIYLDSGRDALDKGVKAISKFLGKCIENRFAQPDAADKPASKRTAKA